MLQICCIVYCVVFDWWMLLHLCGLLSTRIGWTNHAEGNHHLRKYLWCTVSSMSLFFFTFGAFGLLQHTFQGIVLSQIKTEILAYGVHIFSWRNSSQKHIEPEQFLHNYNTDAIPLCLVLINLKVLSLIMSLSFFFLF